MRKFYHIISTVGNPMSLGMIFSFLLYRSEKNNGMNAQMVLIFALIIILPLLSYIAYKVKKGDFADYDVSNRLKRNQLYKVILFLFGGLVILFFVLKYPFKAQLTVFCFFLLLGISSILNNRLKVSMHTSFNFLFAYMLYSLHPLIATGMFLFGFLNGLSRIKLGRHKNKEVLSGFALGNVVGLFFNLVIQLK